MTGKPSKTPEQRKAEREALISTVGEKVATLADSAEWAAYLRFMASFRSYSLNNLLLIMAQLPGASHVAGYRAWQALGRQVRKGERSIKIIGHSTKKVTETDEDTGEETTRRLDRWPVLSVFDVSQTEGDELPAGGFQMPTGADAASVGDQVTAWLTAEGWTVTDEAIGGRANGYTDHTARRVVIDSALEPAGRAAVLLHEAAHAVLHDGLEAGEYQQHRGLYETEAESVAYVLACLLGTPADAKSIPYIAGWSSTDPDLIRTTAANVLRGVNTIAAGLELDHEDDDQDEEEAA